MPFRRPAASLKRQRAVLGTAGTGPPRGRILTCSPGAPEVLARPRARTAGLGVGVAAWGSPHAPLRSHGLGAGHVAQVWKRGWRRGHSRVSSHGGTACRAITLCKALAPPFQSKARGCVLQSPGSLGWLPASSSPLRPWPDPCSAPSSAAQLYSPLRPAQPVLCFLFLPCLPHSPVSHQPSHLSSRATQWISLHKWVILTPPKPAGTLFPHHRDSTGLQHCQRSQTQPWELPSMPTRDWLYAVLAALTKE